MGERPASKSVTGVSRASVQSHLQGETAEGNYQRLRMKVQEDLSVLKSTGAESSGSGGGRRPRGLWTCQMVRSIKRQISPNRMTWHIKRKVGLEG